MGMFFAPMANVILSSVSPAEEGKASGANNAVEVGGVFGVAVLASVFTRYGGYASPETFNGARRRDLVGAFVVAAGALAALAIPGKKELPSPNLRWRKPPNAEEGRERPGRVRLPVFPAGRERVRGDHALGLCANFTRRSFGDEPTSTAAASSSSSFQRHSPSFVRTRSRS